jgi:hypothetical protein
MGLHRVRGIPGQTITEMPDSDLGKFRHILAPVVDQWVKTTPDGARVLAAYKAELAKVGAAK